MTSSPTGGSPLPPEARAEVAPTVTPNQFHLHGDGISVSYFPEGLGPVDAGGIGRLMYQDSHRSLNLTGDAVRTVDVADLGTVISVTIAPTVDVGYTSFNLLLPRVDLPSQMGASVSIGTYGITTVHRAFVLLLGHSQVETYMVTPLSGTALRGILPL